MTAQTSNSDPNFDHDVSARRRPTPICPSAPGSGLGGALAPEAVVGAVIAAGMGAGAAEAPDGVDATLNPTAPRGGPVGSVATRAGTAGADSGVSVGSAVASPCGCSGAGPVGAPPGGDVAFTGPLESVLEQVKHGKMSSRLNACGAARSRMRSTCCRLLLPNSSRRAGTSWSYGLCSLIAWSSSWPSGALVTDACAPLAVPGNV